MKMAGNRAYALSSLQLCIIKSLQPYPKLNSHHVLDLRTASYYSWQILLLFNSSKHKIPIFFKVPTFWTRKILFRFRVSNINAI